jgi:hypothetical protein
MTNSNIEIPDLEVLSALLRELNGGTTNLRGLYEDDKVSNTECIVAVSKLIGLCAGIQNEALLLQGDFSQLSRLATKPKGEVPGIFESIFGGKSREKN